ncbi:uncharacterized protein LOC127790685 [Diospyros lotus]|uniref:uncharacterized protein LOC127790685 n=1 Tax=Diospyros lotus TaxID=55363 RepID=UPI00225636F8|nr:uncharacterized protein LOC127790685 [Diospyros lotus]
MCPLRFILVFLSAMLAGFLALRTLRSSPGVGFMDSGSSSTPEEISPKENKEFELKKTILNGLWVFGDMASGRYLWRNLGEMKKVKSS